MTGSGMHLARALVTREHSTVSRSREPGLDQQVPSELAFERRQLLVADVLPLRRLLVLVAPVSVDVPREDVRLADVGHVEAVEQRADALVRVRVGHGAA